MVKRYSETRFNSEGFDSPVNEIGVFENSHGEYVKFTDYDSREGELLALLGAAICPNERNSGHEQAWQCQWCDERKRLCSPASGGADGG